MVTVAAPVVDKRLWKFSVADYGVMIEAGILKKEDRVELIDGEVLTMAPIGSRHAASVKRLIRLLTSRTGDEYVIGGLGRQPSRSRGMGSVKGRM